MKIAVLGMGAYGIALAKIFYENDNIVSIWTKFREELEAVLVKRENTAVLPGIKIPKGIELTDVMGKCVNGADVIVLAIPMNAVRKVLEELNLYLDKKQVVCLVTKGIEDKTGAFVYDIAKEVLNTNNMCILSGPSIAKEMAENSNMGLVIASESNFAKLTVKVCLENKNILINTTDDVVGVQVTSAIKNIFAIFLGYISGINGSDSLKAAVLSKLIFDMKELLKYYNGKEATLFSYAGIGDILLTCMSDKSRNFTFGKLVGSGNNYKKALEMMNTKTVEGLNSLETLYKSFKEKNVKFKSINTLYEIVYKNKKIDNILNSI